MILGLIYLQFHLGSSKSTVALTPIALSTAVAKHVQIEENITIKHLFGGFMVYSMRNNHTVIVFHWNAKIAIHQFLFT